MTPERYLYTMAANNAFANQRLLAAAGRLSPDELIARRTGFFPSILATLSHNLIVDRFYVDALEGGTLGPAAFAEAIPHPRLAPLSAEQAELDQRLLAVCAALTPASLQAPVRMVRARGDTHDRTDRVLLHLFQHQIHHRGQAHAMLSGTSIAPPQLDEFFMTGEAHLRHDELQALGLTEATIWGG